MAPGSKEKVQQICVSDIICSARVRAKFDAERLSAWRRDQRQTWPGAVVEPVNRIRTNDIVERSEPVLCLRVEVPRGPSRTDCCYMPIPPLLAAEGADAGQLTQGRVSHVCCTTCDPLNNQRRDLIVFRLRTGRIQSNYLNLGRAVPEDKRGVLDAAQAPS